MASNMSYTCPFCNEVFSLNKDGMVLFRGPDIDNSCLPASSSLLGLNGDPFRAPPPNGKCFTSFDICHGCCVTMFGEYRIPLSETEKNCCGLVIRDKNDKNGKHRNSYFAHINVYFPVELLKTPKDVQFLFENMCSYYYCKDHWHTLFTYYYCKDHWHTLFTYDGKV